MDVKLLLDQLQAESSIQIKRRNESFVPSFRPFQLQNITQRAEIARGDATGSLTLSLPAYHSRQWNYWHIYATAVAIMVNNQNELNNRTSINGLDQNQLKLIFFNWRNYMPISQCSWMIRISSRNLHKISRKYKNQTSRTTVLQQKLDSTPRQEIN